MTDGMGSLKTVLQLELPGVKLIEANGSSDARGSNIKIFSAKELELEGIDFIPQEILLIHSNQHALRGLHYQAKYGQSRILSCREGELFVAVADVDPDRDTAGQHCTCILSRPTQYLYVPAGYAVGTYAIKDSDFLCMCGDHPFMKDCAAGIRWDDPDIGISWPNRGKDALLSDADRKLTWFRTAADGPCRN